MLFLRKEDEEAERRLVLLQQALLRPPVAPPPPLRLKDAVPQQHPPLRQVEEVVRRSTLRGPGFPSSLKTGLNGCLRIRLAPAFWVDAVVVVVAAVVQLEQEEVGPQYRQLLRIPAESTGLAEACAFRED